MASEVAPASTLVLARDFEGQLEVFLSRRTSRAAFMANAYVYPGGRLDPGDLDPRVLRRLGPSDLAEVADFEDEVASEVRSGLVVAALRESFEEAGVLFGFCAGDGASPLDTLTLASARVALNNGQFSFADFLERYDLHLDASGLRYFAHWITPPFESRRFDTRFFIAPVPEGQAAEPDFGELVAGQWMSPTRALQRHTAGELHLAPPTLCTLFDLADLDGVRAALDWAARERPVPIEPRLESVDGVPTLLLPGDPLFPSSAPAPKPCRIVVRDGWFERIPLG